MKLNDRFFKNRVKPILITQFILIFPMAVFVFLSFSTYPANFIYSGFIGIILAISMFFKWNRTIYFKKESMVNFFLYLNSINNFCCSTEFFCFNLK